MAETKFTDEQIAFNARWVEALRSGKYRQGIGALKEAQGDGFKHCCLGVACELAGLDSRPSDDETDDACPDACPDEWGFLFGDNDDPAFTLPLESWFVRTTGLPSRLMSSLATFNDTGERFSEIADRIEAALSKARGEAQ